MTKKWLFICAFNVLLAFVLCEITLKITQRLLRIEVGTLAFLRYAESFEFYQRKIAHREAPEATPPKHFDRLLGWRNMEGLGDDLFQGFRTRPFDEVKTKKRVILLGDSFMYGMWNKESDTIANRLQGYLGDDFEVINLAVKGFGFDQIYLSATEIAVPLKPDHIVFSFIGDDLRRSCTDFGFSYRKPQFYLESNGELLLTGVPVPTPRETHDFHVDRAAQLKDTAIFFALKSSLFRFAVDTLNRSDFNLCQNEMHLKLIEMTVEKFSKNSHLLFVHLDGKLPPRFEKNIAKVTSSFLSFPSQLPTLAKEYQLEVAYHSDGHPMPSLSEIYARKIAATLKERWLLSAIPKN